MVALTIWWALVYMLIVGMAAGWLAWVVLGKDKSLSRDRKPNWTLLFAIGIAGSLVGGLGMSLLLGQGLQLRPSGLIASALGAILVASIYVSMQRRKKMAAS